MQLYVTAESERATKGQGGNKFVAVKFEVQHDSGERDTMLELVLTRHVDKFTVQEKHSAQVWSSLQVRK